MDFAFLMDLKSSLPCHQTRSHAKVVSLVIISKLKMVSSIVFRHLRLKTNPGQTTNAPALKIAAPMCRLTRVKCWQRSTSHANVDWIQAATLSVPKYTHRPSRKPCNNSQPRSTPLLRSTPLKTTSNTSAIHWTDIASTSAWWGAWIPRTKLCWMNTS